MKYKYLLFDVDDTLLDFQHAFLGAQKNSAMKLQMEYSDEYINKHSKSGWKAWMESGMEDTSSKDVQDNYHKYYFDYLEKHCSYLAEELGKTIDKDEFINCYLESIMCSRRPVEEDTLEIYRELSKNYKLVLTTNGISKVQRERIKDFLPTTYKVFISEEVGCIKPAKGFFEYVLKTLNCSPEECLMIGDSISNDMQGAIGVGIDTCFYNIKKKEIPKDVKFDYVIENIKELTKLKTYINI